VAPRVTRGGSYLVCRASAVEREPHANPKPSPSNVSPTDQNPACEASFTCSRPLSRRTRGALLQSCPPTIIFAWLFRSAAGITLRNGPHCRLCCTVHAPGTRGTDARGRTLRLTLRLRRQVRPLHVNIAVTVNGVSCLPVVSLAKAIQCKPMDGPNLGRVGWPRHYIPSAYDADCKTAPSDDALYFT
jgi:hypothetical protein